MRDDLTEGCPFVIRKTEHGGNMFLSEAETIENISKIDRYIDQFLEWLFDKALDLLGAVVFLFIGFKVSKGIVRLIKKSFVRSGLETSVAGFLVSLIKGVLYSVVFIMAASIVGFQVTSLVTILGTASLAIGLALQGSLSNFAGGVLILLMKPFKVGDYIIENGTKCEGTVESIDIFYTKLRTYDNRIAVIPNGSITSNSLINVTQESLRKLEILVGVAYNSDLKRVKEVLTDIISNSKYCEADQDYHVYVDSFQDSSITMGIRCFVKTEDYWSAKWELLETIKNEFDDNNIVIPFNQLDVKVTNQGEAK